MVDVSTHNYEKERADDTNMHMLICCTICFRSVFIHLSGDMFLFDGENIVSTDRSMYISLVTACIFEGGRAGIYLQE